MKTIEKTVTINAPKEKVWEVLLDDKYTRQWYEEFSPGSHADTDWQQGSKATFTDTDGNGIFGTIITNNPYQEVTIRYDGLCYNGKEDTESDYAQVYKGALETYKLVEEGGVTTLSISSEMEEKYFDSMSAAWDKALQRLKAFAEA